jgi:hypothetical protein
MYYMDGRLPSGYTDSVHTITSEMYPSDKVLLWTEKKPKSLEDLFKLSTSFDEFMNLFFDNPWVLFVWFNI